MHPGTLDASSGLLTQFLAWVAKQPRTYDETMDAWRTSCPRISVWEDALIEGLVATEGAAADAQGAVKVVLTHAGVARLRAPVVARSASTQAAGAFRSSPPTM